MNSIFTFRLQSAALASRSSAAALRATLEKALDEGIVRLDFSDVDSVSESYADELLGVLVASRSLPWVFERLELYAIQPAVAHTIASALKRRISKESSGGFSGAVESAKEALVRHRRIPA